MEILAIIAILVSPIIAVLVSMRTQDRKERRQNRLQLLSSLIATRHELMLTAESVRALNLIDVVFHNKKEVRRLWKEYFDMLHNQGLMNPPGYAQWNKKKLELITEMAKVLGYGKEITHLDMDRVYSPVGLTEQTQRTNLLIDELLRVLKATKRFDFETDHEQLQPQEPTPKLPPPSPSS